MPIDWNSVILQVILGFFGIVTPAVLLYIQKTVKDQQAANTLGNAMTNALGAMKQAAVSATAAGVPASQYGAHPIKMPDGSTGDLDVGTRYVIRHAEKEAARFGIHEDAIADKIRSRIGNVMLEPVGVVVVAAKDGAPSPALPFNLGRVTPSAPPGGGDGAPA